MNNFLNPDVVEITLHEGTYRGEHQLYGIANGHKYVLLTRKSVHPRAGECWQVRYKHSPNGHIIFCIPERYVEDNEHPIVGALKPFCGHSVTRVIPPPRVHHMMLGDPRAWRPTVLRGKLRRCEVVFEKVVLDIDGVKVYYDEWEFEEELKHHFGKLTSRVYDSHHRAMIDITFWK